MKHLLHGTDEQKAWAYHEFFKLHLEAHVKSQVRMNLTKYVYSDRYRQDLQGPKHPARRRTSSATCWTSWTEWKPKILQRRTNGVPAADANSTCEKTLGLRCQIMVRGVQPRLQLAVR